MHAINSGGQLQAFWNVSQCRIEPKEQFPMLSESNELKLYRHAVLPVHCTPWDVHFFFESLQNKFLLFAKFKSSHPSTPFIRQWPLLDLQILP